MSAFNTDNATHIFNWASSSAEHYRRMCALAKYPRTGSFVASAAGQAFTLANETYRAMKADRDEFAAGDIMAAAIMFLNWEGEQ